MIVTKVMRLKVHYAQGRRILCPLCRKPFTYLAEGNLSADTSGLPLLSSDEGMRKVVADIAKKRLLKADRKERWGEGYCPHCRRYAPWMVRRSRFWKFLKWGAGGWVLGSLAWSFTALQFQDPGSPMTLKGKVLILLPFAAMAGGIFVGWKRSLPGGRVPGKDSPFSLTDEDLSTLFVHSRESGEDPVAAWWATVYAAPPEGHAFVTMGFRDFARGGAVPAEWESEAVLSRL